MVNRAFAPLRTLLCALLLTALVVACARPAAGTLAPDPTPFPTNAVVRLRDAIQETLAERSVKFDFEAIVTGSSAIWYGTSFGATGSSTLGEPRQMSVLSDFREIGLGEIEEIVDGERSYMRGGFFEDFLKPGKWALLDEASDDPKVTQLIEASSRVSDISMVIYFLYGEIGPVVQRPPQQLRGLPASRFALTVDLERAADAVPASERAAMLGQIDALRAAGMERTLDAEVWIRDDGLIHRLIVTYEISALKGGGSMRITYDFLDFGDPVEIEIPARKDVVPIEDLL